MDTSVDTFALRRAHEHKLFEALDVLEQARLLVTACRGTRDSARALGGEAAQAHHRHRELLSDAARLTATAERLMLEARAICGEQSDH